MAYFAFEAGTLLAGETVTMAFDRQGGVLADASRVRDGLVLTDRRVIRVSRIVGLQRTGSALLRDVQYMELAIKGRSVKALVIAVALLLGGALTLGLSTADLPGLLLQKSVSAAGIETGANDAGAMVMGTLGGFTGMFRDALRMGGLAMLLLSPLMFLLFAISGGIVVGVTMGSEQVTLAVPRSRRDGAQALINRFFALKTGAQ